MPLIIPLMPVAQWLNLVSDICRIGRFKQRLKVVVQCSRKEQGSELLCSCFSHCISTVNIASTSRRRRNSRSCSAGPEADLGAAAASGRIVVSTAAAVAVAATFPATRTPTATRRVADLAVSVRYRWVNWVVSEQLTVNQDTDTGSAHFSGTLPGADHVGFILSCFGSHNQWTIYHAGLAYSMCVGEWYAVVNWHNFSSHAVHHHKLQMC